MRQPFARFAAYSAASGAAKLRQEGVRYSTNNYVDRLLSAAKLPSLAAVSGCANWCQVAATVPAIVVLRCDIVPSGAIRYVERTRLMMQRLSLQSLDIFTIRLLDKNVHSYIDF